MNYVTGKDIEFVESRSWYQRIRFASGLVSNGVDWCGDPAWENIRTFLPEKLEGLRILDLGCNAGIFCVRAALEGAVAVGVDWPGWRVGWDFKEQQVFVKEYFERRHQRTLNITYHSCRMEEFLQRKDIGYFDYVLGIASLYYTEDPLAVSRAISNITDNVIVRLRDNNIISRWTDLFIRCGFTERKFLQEKWWDKLKRPTDDFYLYHYAKEKDLVVYYHRIVKGHREIAGTDELLDIWQLMDLVGTQVPVEEYTQRIPEELITYLPLTAFSNLKKKGGPLVRFVPDQEQKEAYPWEELARSIKERGFLTPIIAAEIEEEGEIRYKALEGRHRLAAATMIEPFDVNYKIPCVIVRKEGHRV